MHSFQKTANVYIKQRFILTFKFKNYAILVQIVSVHYSWQSYVNNVEKYCESKIKEDIK